MVYISISLIYQEKLRKLYLHLNLFNDFGNLLMSSLLKIILRQFKLNLLDFLR